MKEFTAAEVKRHTGDIWKEVEQNGIAVIKHRDRDDMVIVKKSELEVLQNSVGTLCKKVMENKMSKEK